MDNAIILQYLERIGYHTPAAAYAAQLREYLAWYRGYVSDFHDYTMAKMYTLGSGFIPSANHAGGLRYHGMSAHDAVSLDGQVHDPNRVDFMHRYLLALRRAADDGVDVAGYFAWSLLDNFEWSSGYRERFGLIYVDYATQARTPKDSALWYQQVMAANGETL